MKEVLNLRRYSGLFLRPKGEKPWVKSEMYFISLTELMLWIFLAELIRILLADKVF